MQPAHVQEDGEEEAGQEGQVQDTARHVHGDQGEDGGGGDDDGGGGDGGGNFPPNFCSYS